MILRWIGLSLLFAGAGFAQVRSREVQTFIQSLSKYLSRTLGKVVPSQARVANVWLVDSLLKIRLMPAEAVGTQLS
ncbi:MAG: hypothetical protein NZ958_07550 [Bacteroidia bacterium]|nr:hypothetical protein [Bacteroidia bacterium]